MSDLSNYDGRKEEPPYLTNEESAVQAERERCAALCEEAAEIHDGEIGAILTTLADLIRNPVE